MYEDSKWVPIEEKKYKQSKRERKNIKFVRDNFLNMDVLPSMMINFSYRRDNKELEECVFLTYNTPLLFSVRLCFKVDLDVDHDEFKITFMAKYDSIFEHALKMNELIKEKKNRDKIQCIESSSIESQ